MADVISIINNLQKDIVTNLNNLNLKYFDSIPSPAFGSINNINNLNTDTFSSKLLSDLIFNNLLDPSINNDGNHFNLNYDKNDNLISYVTIDTDGNYNTNTIPISQITQGTGLFSNVASQLLGKGLITTAIMFNDIPNTKGSKVLSPNHMEVLYFLYDLFSDANFKGYFIQGSSVNLKNPFVPYKLKLTRDPTTNKTNALMISQSINDIPQPPSYDFDSIMLDLLGFDTSIITNNKKKYSNLTDVNKLNNFAIKRIIYLCIMSINIHYALSASYNYTRSKYNSKTNNTTQYYSDRRIISFNCLINTLITILQSTTSQSTIDNIMNSVANEMNIYKDNIDSINTLSNSFNKSRTDLTYQKNKLSGDANSEKNVKKFEYISFAVLLVIVFAVISIYVMDIDNRQKIMYIGGVTLIAIFVTILINSLFNKMESFANPVGSSNRNNNTSKASEVITTDYQNNAIATLKVIDDYIKNTSILISQIDTYNAYHVVNYSIGNETVYFAGQKDEISLTSTKVKNVLDINSITKSEESARMNLFLILAIITAATACANVATNSLPVLQKIVTIIGGVIAVIAFILYLIDITYIVRTDGKRKYYGIKQIDAEKLLK